MITQDKGKNRENIKLLSPKHSGKISVEEAISKRRSIREFKNEALTLSEISQILWSAYGITNRMGFRTIPSAGALCPLEIYLVAGNTNNLPAGIYKYQPETNTLITIQLGDKRIELCKASLEQECVKDAAIVIIISAVYERTTGRYGQRGIRYVFMEVGHAAQNIYLQSTALNLGTVSIGAFHDDKVKKILNLPEKEEPLLLMPIGKI